MAPPTPSGSQRPAQSWSHSLSSATRVAASSFISSWEPKELVPVGRSLAQARIGRQAEPLAGFPLWPGRLRFACGADHPFASGGPLTFQDAATQPLCLVEDLPLPPRACVPRRSAAISTGRSPCAPLPGAISRPRASPRSRPPATTSFFLTWTVSITPVRSAPLSSPATRSPSCSYFPGLRRRPRAESVPAEPGRPLYIIVLSRYLNHQTIPSGWISL